MAHIKRVGSHIYVFDFTEVNAQQAKWRAEHRWASRWIPNDPDNPFAAPGNCLDDADCFDYGIPCGY